MLDTSTLPLLRKSRNLLAFSGGGDSTALFYLLCDAKIDFDIIHVNYHTRAQCADEASYAQSLAEKYSKKIYLYDAPPLSCNFEAEARKIRYDFFHQCIYEHKYDLLLTAHQLGDRLEWFLMQLSKGAGLYELMGMKNIEQRDHHILVRPLLHVNKEELLNYLNKREILWFEDESNTDERYRRNYFRHNFSEPLLKKFSPQIAKSFRYLDEDATITDIEALHVKELSYFKTLSNPRHNLYHIDKILKKRGFIMRQGDKEILKTKSSHVVGRKYSVCVTKHYTFIAPYSHSIMTKAFKEACRKLKIPEKLRTYLSTDAVSFDKVVSLLSIE
ncbi:MAG: tRNA lysidine(34) synthetase TilS [Campylobacterota bacterium]|nr:tRNA lysidine(34) synthetase TilS [Campylobacterota bacterium]